ncbi:MAG: preprotein translocase subunit SecG [Cytophagales bacterium]|nr:preprotein translocase subunit SecG [Cytophagales bacterium]
MVGFPASSGGSGASNLIGVKKTGDLLERFTWGFAIAIMVFSLATNFATPQYELRR